MEVQAILSFLTLFSQESKIIVDLNNYFKFDHNVFLVDSSVDVRNLFRNGNHTNTTITTIVFEFFLNHFPPRFFNLI